MAKSKSGGTRSFIRGRVGADVYSIGRDGAGKKQQVVRSLAETVANPQTLAQMEGRMIMSTVMQAQSALSRLIDHSFDGVPTGQPSISEFIRRNYAILKTNGVNFNEYKEKGMMANPYQIASGNAVRPANVGFGKNHIVSSPNFNKWGAFEISNVPANATFAQLKALVGITSLEDYFTLVHLQVFTFTSTDLQDRQRVIPPVLQFVRVHLSSTMADETVLTADNIANAFELDSNATGLTVEFADNTIAINLPNMAGILGAVGGIVSQKSGSAWIHNDAFMYCLPVEGAYSKYDSALATYPIGKQMFLNGGEL